MQAKFIIANDKGGVGKSTVAQYCILHLMQSRGPVRIAEYDRQPKLRRFFGDGVITHSIGPEWERQFTDPTSLTTFLDPLVKWIQVERPLVVDFGAQVWDYFRAWADNVMLPEIIDTGRVTVLIPVTADAEAVVGASKIVASARTVLPNARLVLLFCDKDGEVNLLRNVAEFRELEHAVREGRAVVRKIPVMAREGYPLVASYGWRLDQICRAKPADLVSATGASLMVASRTIKAVRAWVEGMDDELSDVLGCPKPPNETESPAKQDAEV